MLGEESTIGEDVDRHCKIRFVEKIINTIAGHEEGENTMEDSWTIPNIAESLNAPGAESQLSRSTHSGYDGSDMGNNPLGNSGTLSGEEEKGKLYVKVDEDTQMKLNPPLSNTSESTHSGSHSSMKELAGSQLGSITPTVEKEKEMQRVSPNPNSISLAGGGGNPLEFLDDAEVSGNEARSYELLPNQKPFLTPSLVLLVAAHGHERRPAGFPFGLAAHSYCRNARRDVRF